MYILPEPQKINISDDKFYLRCDASIIISKNCDLKANNYARILKEDIQENTGFSLAISRGEAKKNSIYLGLDKNLKEQGYRLTISKNKVIILGGSETAILYGIQTLRQIIAQEAAVLSCLEIYDYPQIENRGFYHDATRGRIPTIEYLKKFADKLSYYKINQFQLYIEHSFLFEDFSEVWRDDTPLTAEEIMELDEYCKDLDIDLVPSIASFGHLYEVLSTKSYEHLCELEAAAEEEFSFLSRMQHHTIDASNPESLEFIKNMISEYMPLFSSDYFNICSDETFDLGKGRSKELAAEIGTQQMYIDFLNELAEFLLEKGKTPMFWGDIISKFPERINDLPEESICLNWGYAPEQREHETKVLAEAGATQYLCPGVGGWNQMINLIESSYKNITLMCDYAEKYDAIGILNTDWGDFGHINHPEFSTAGMIYGATFSWNNKEKDFAEINKEISLLEFGDQSEELLSLIAEIPVLSEFGWELVVRFQEMKQLDRADEMVAEYFEAFELESVKKANEKLAEKIDKLYQNISDLVPKKRDIVKSYIIAARAILFFNKLASVINSKDYAGSENEISATELAVDLEYWLQDYRKLWLSVSKESEFYRIRDVIIWYADYLRGIN
ncbi:glycoside hydrolase family 20 zincin-like fold domain-containing protein [Halanaerobium sp. ST460_2HS_T2]|uniref:glycoside hydrolase family 20 zincin-like fold domain-containing protein n=1 Tax=Halanaerobium sp. ST460_2HS_T2 TaxID=2183914 RepID=UPI000DF21749|nr:glycoside hydrolase family 20 zincin-like fold domain-containing protein [Halanaerobium sp. ST460_2HS_T2]RCW62484.1 glycosyl hydrolase family 20 [Halanaerobium sp. ST460_2HS_T2]